MIKIAFSITPEFFERYSAMSEEKKYLFVEILASMMHGIFPGHTSLNVVRNSEKIMMEVNGVSAFKDGDLERYVQEVANKLSFLNLRSFFYISSAGCSLQAQDILLSPTSNRFFNCNEALTQIFTIEDKLIPQDYVCPISGRIMDNPAFLTSNPKVSYEYTSLFEWITANHSDPTTRAKISAPGIVLNPTLKQKISTFIIECSQGKDIQHHHAPVKSVGTGTEGNVEFKKDLSLGDKKSGTFFAGTSSVSSASEMGAGDAKPSLACSYPISDAKSCSVMYQMFSTCKLQGEFDKILSKSLRRASASGLIDEIKLIFTICKPDLIINSQDDNQLIQNTPLHYAIEKGHVSTVKLLLEHGAKFDIANAKKLTALDMMKASQIKEMVEIAENLGAKAKPEITTSGTLTM